MKKSVIETLLERKELIGEESCQLRPIQNLLSGSSSSCPLSCLESLLNSAVQAPIKVDQK